MVPFLVKGTQSGENTGYNLLDIYTGSGSQQKKEGVYHMFKYRQYVYP